MFRSTHSRWRRHASVQTICVLGKTGVFVMHRLRGDSPRRLASDVFSVIRTVINVECVLCEYLCVRLGAETVLRARLRAKELKKKTKVHT